MGAAGKLDGGGGWVGCRWWATDIAATAAATASATYAKPDQSNVWGQGLKVGDVSCEG